MVILRVAQKEIHYRRLIIQSNPTTNNQHKQSKKPQRMVKLTQLMIQLNQILHKI
jgi:hypothetical protein